MTTVNFNLDSIFVPLSLSPLYFLPYFSISRDKRTALYSQKKKERRNALKYKATASSRGTKKCHCCWSMKTSSEYENINY